MAYCAYPIAATAGTYQGNALGLGIPSIPAPACRPALLKDCTPCEPGFVKVHAYEASTIPDFVAYTTDGLVDKPQATMRVIRSKDGYAIGSAVSAVTGLPTGFLLKVSSAGFATVVTPLTETLSTGSVYNLVHPRGLDVCGHIITIVGEGEFEGALFTALARVDVKQKTPCNRVKIILANNDFDADADSEDGPPQEGEQYYDVAANPFDASTVYICGSARGVASMFLVNRQYGYTVKSALIDLPLDMPSVATCFGIVSSCMVVVGVQTETSSSLLWTLSLETLNELQATGTTTDYNDAITKRLRLPADCHHVDVFKLFVQPSGAVFAVATAWFVAEDTSLPSSGVVVYKFTPDTYPDMCFGVSGVSVWYDARAMSTRPCDALLLDESVFVVGNSYTNLLSDSSDTDVYVNPCLPYLSSTMTAPPVPFLITVRYDGSACPLLTGLRTCGEGLFANTLMVSTNLGVSLVLLGDVWFHLGVPSQPAGLLAVDIALKPCARVLNMQEILIPTLTYGDCSSCKPVLLDKKCDGTIFQVAGPVVVGNNDCALVLPGSIAFDHTTGNFMGFNGTEWRVFNTSIVS